MDDDGGGVGDEELVDLVSVTVAGGVVTIVESSVVTGGVVVVASEVGTAYKKRLEYQSLYQQWTLYIPQSSV